MEVVVSEGEGDDGWCNQANAARLSIPVAVSVRMQGSSGSFRRWLDGVVQSESNGSTTRRQDA